MSSATTQDEEEQTGIFCRIRRHKYLFSGVFALTLGLVAALYAVVPRSYQGQAEIMLATPEPLLGGEVDPTIEAKQGDPADVASQVVVLASLNLLQEVAAKPAIAVLIRRECEARKLQPLGRVIDIVKPAHCDALQTDAAAGSRYLHGRLDVSNDGRSRVIELTHSSPLPEAAEIIPNAVAAAFIAEKLRDKLDSRLAAVTWLRSEIGRISRDLVRTEAQIEAFHSEHGLVRGQTALIASEQLTEIGQQLANARAARSAAAGELAQIQHGAAEAPATLENLAIADVKQQLAIVEGQAADVASMHGADYPELTALRRQEGALGARLKLETARIAGSLRQQYLSATAKVTALEAQLGQAKAQVAAETDAETKIASLQRHAEVQRELFLDLSKKVDTLEIERRILSSNARIVSSAPYPDQIHFPRKLPFVLGGLMLATIASVAATLLLDRRDETVRTRRDVERAAGIPMLGYTPALRNAVLGSCRQVLTPGALQDALRRLFATSVLMRAPNQPRSIVVSSALPREGKTFATLALAQFAARSGRRVLAVEGDLRRPDFTKVLAATATKGLADYLRGEAQCEEIVATDEVAGLDFIIAGKATFSSTELLSNARLRELLAWAHERYDLVLIDSPPTEAVPDTCLLAKEADAVLFCARWGSSDPRLVAEAVRELTDAGAHVLGLVLGRVNTERMHLYGGYRRYGADYRPQLIS